MTVRRATAALVDEGWLVKQPGRGTFVARAKVPVTPVTLASFSHTMQGIGLSVTSEVIDLALVSAPREVQRQLGLKDKAVFLRRLRFIDGEAMALMSSYMAPLFLEPLQQADLTKYPLTAVMEQVSGLKLSSSQDVIEASLASAEEAALLGMQKGDPVLLERGLIRADTGEAVRLSKIVYRGDRVRLSVSGHSDTQTQVRVSLTGTYANDSSPDPADDTWLGLSFRLAK
jgi:GntR family transcriptional regulator